MAQVLGRARGGKSSDDGAAIFPANQGFYTSTSLMYKILEQTDDGDPNFRSRMVRIVLRQSRKFPVSFLPRKRFDKSWLVDGIFWCCDVEKKISLSNSKILRTRARTWPFTEISPKELVNKICSVRLLGQI